MTWYNHVSRRAFLANGAAFGAAASALSACGGGAGKPGEASDLASIDAVQTSTLIKNGELTSVEAVGAAIDRAQAIDPLINAIVTPTFDSARSAAADPRNAPFPGIPSFVKDLTDVTGQPTRFGSAAFANYVASGQTPFVDKFFEIGLISLGKTSTPEFGLTATTEPLAQGPTRNPWNVDHSTGGSSGGAAALVAAGVVPIAHASDGGGSIRIPASSCGLVGLKCTRGRLPLAYDPEGIPILLSESGVVTRTVRDTAAFFASMAVPPEANDLPALGLVTGPSKRRLKIGVYTDGVVGDGVEPQVAEATRKVAALCDDLGHAVEEIAAPFNAAGTDDFLLYWASGAARNVGKWEEMAGRKASYVDFEPLTFGLISHYQSRKSQLEDAIGRLMAFPDMYAKAIGDFDVFLSPVLAAPPPAIGYLRTDISYETAIKRVTDYAQFTGTHNVAGTPSMSLPLSMSSGGLPIGSLFSAKAGDDATLLELAFELEEASPWRGRRPAVFGTIG